MVGMKVALLKYALRASDFCAFEILKDELLMQTGLTLILSDRELLEVNLPEKLKEGFEMILVEIMKEFPGSQRAFGIEA